MSTPASEAHTEEMTFAAAVKAAIAEEMRRDPKVFLMGEDVKFGVWGTTAGLQDEFADRVLHLPISEYGFCCAAVGAAMTGMRPVVEIMYADFVLLALDALANQAAKYRYMCGGDPFRIPLVVKLAGSGIGAGSGCHHSQTLEAVLMHFPGLKVVAPSTPAEAKGLLKAAIRDDNPVVFVEAKLLYPETGPVPQGEYTMPIGQAEVVREGHDLTIVSHSYALVKALAAAETLAAGAISAEVISLRSLAPLDRATILDSVSRTGRLMVVEDGCKTLGVGAEIAALVAEEGLFYLNAPVCRMAGADAIIAAGRKAEVSFVPSEEEIVSAASRLVRQSA